MFVPFLYLYQSHNKKNTSADWYEWVSPQVPDQVKILTAGQTQFNAYLILWGPLCDSCQIKTNCYSMIIYDWPRGSNRVKDSDGGWYVDNTEFWYRDFWYKDGCRNYYAIESKCHNVREHASCHKEAIHQVQLPPHW